MTIERILVADESCEALEKLASQLTAYGYDVFLASNSDELLQIAATDTCDMAIININLSGGEGLERAQSVATRSPDLFIAVMGDPDNLNSHSHELLAAARRVPRPGRYRTVGPLVDGRPGLRLHPAFHRHLPRHNQPGRFRGRRGEAPRHQYLVQPAFRQRRPHRRFNKAPAAAAIPAAFRSYLSNSCCGVPCSTYSSG